MVRAKNGVFGTEPRKPLHQQGRKIGYSMVPPDDMAVIIRKREKKKEKEKEKEKEIRVVLPLQREVSLPKDDPVTCVEIFIKSFQEKWVVYEGLLCPKTPLSELIKIHRGIICLYNLGIEVMHVVRGFATSCVPMITATVAADHFLTLSEYVPQDLLHRYSPIFDDLWTSSAFGPKFEMPIEKFAFYGNHCVTKEPGLNLAFPQLKMVDRWSKLLLGNKRGGQYVEREVENRLYDLLFLFSFNAKDAERFSDFFAVLSEDNFQSFDGSWKFLPRILEGIPAHVSLFSP